MKPLPLNGPLRVAAYCRVSTDKEDQLNSLSAQRQFFQKYITEHPGWSLVRVFADEGLSGTSIKRRPQFAEMISRALDGEIDLIITKEVSRFARNTVDTLQVTRKLKEKGVGVLFLNDNIDTRDNDGEFRLTIMASVAQEESRKISERTRWGQLQAMKRGVVFGNQSLYGYTLANGQLTVEPEQAEVVRLVYHKFLVERKGSHTIARELTEAGIRPPLRPNGALTSTMIVKLLRNEKYCGDLLQKKYRTTDNLSHRKILNDGTEEQVLLRDHHEPIVSRGDFEAVQAILETARSRYQSRLGVYDHLGKSENILKGLVFCGDCGKPMVRYKQVSHGKSVTYHYTCPNYAAQLERSGCSYKFLREDILMDALTEMILAEIRQTVDGLKLAQRLSAANRAQAENLSLELKRLNSELARAETAKKGAMEDYLCGLLSREDYERLKSACVGETTRLKGRISVLQTDYTKQTETLTQGNPWLQTFGEIDLKDGLTGLLAHSLIQRVTVYENNRIDVILRYRDEKEQLLTAEVTGEVVA